MDGWPAQEASLKKNNIRYEGHIWPNSVHGFFNDATPERYNKVTAQEAWTRTIEWFNHICAGTRRLNEQRSVPSTAAHQHAFSASRGVAVPRAGNRKAGFGLFFRAAVRPAKSPKSCLS